jgi:hypothetical protein
MTHRPDEHSGRTSIEVDRESDPEGAVEEGLVVAAHERDAQPSEELVAEMLSVEVDRSVDVLRGEAPSGTNRSSLPTQVQQLAGFRHERGVVSARATLRA